MHLSLKKVFWGKGQKHSQNKYLATLYHAVIEPGLFLPLAILKVRNIILSHSMKLNSILILIFLFILRKSKQDSISFQYLLSSTGHPDFCNSDLVAIAVLYILLKC